jgi:hypothetical protein
MVDENDWDSLREDAPAGRRVIESITKCLCALVPARLGGRITHDKQRPVPGCTRLGLDSASAKTQPGLAIAGPLSGFLPISKLLLFCHSLSPLSSIGTDRDV